MMFELLDSGIYLRIYVDWSCYSLFPEYNNDPLVFSYLLVGALLNALLRKSSVCVWETGYELSRDSG